MIIYDLSDRELNRLAREATERECWATAIAIFHEQDRRRKRTVPPIPLPHITNLLGGHAA
jgi:hypothetical protein